MKREKEPPYEVSRELIERVSRIIGPASGAARALKVAGDNPEARFFRVEGSYIVQLPKEKTE